MKNEIQENLLKSHFFSHPISAKFTKSCPVDWERVFLPGHADDVVNASKSCCFSHVHISGHYLFTRSSVLLDFFFEMSDKDAVMSLSDSVSNKNSSDESSSDEMQVVGIVQP